MMDTDTAAAAFKGVIATPITPFKDDFSLDLGAIETNAQALLDGGAAGFVVCGSIGELPTLDMDEWAQIVRRTIAVSRAAVPVFATVGHTDMRVIREMTRKAAELGVTGIVVVPPYYFALSRSEIIDFYRGIDAMGVPFVVYNHPGTGRPTIDARAIEEIAALDHFCGLKEATADGNEFTRKRELLKGRAHVLAAAESQLFYMACAGADGCLTAVSAFAPHFLVRYLDVLENGSLVQAREMNARLMSFREIVHAVSASGATGYLTVTKAAVDIMGLVAGPPRPSVATLSRELRGQLESVLRERLRVLE